MHQPGIRFVDRRLYVGGDALASAATERLPRADDRLSVRRTATATDALALLDADPTVDCVVSDADLPETDYIAFADGETPIYDDVRSVDGSLDDGTGLGLAIGERIAGENGWSIAAVAADGGSARFEFRV